MKATAIANANIALSKYWGKRDKVLMLPNNGSISMTCDGLRTTTTVEFSDKYEDDIVILNVKELLKEKKGIIGHLDLIREMAGIKRKAKVVSKSNFPIAAGLASSASGFAALSVAGAKAAGLKLDKRELSILSRRGSGSASRSILGGFVEWKKGELPDGSDSFAVKIAPKNHWPEFRMIATIVAEARKKVSSRAGMARTVETCPFYKDWLETVDENLKHIRRGILERDFKTVAETAEHNCLKLHATMITTKPAIIYWNAATMEIIQSVLLWREEGLPCYFTIDAGPNVKVMVLQENEDELNKRLLELEGVKKTMLCKPGDDAKICDKHLF